jgi:hypothetical protein
VAIAETQLERWCQQGKTGQFTDTYSSILWNILDASAPYEVKNVDIHLRARMATTRTYGRIAT